MSGLDNSSRDSSIAGTVIGEDAGSGVGLAERAGGCSGHRASPAALNPRAAALAQLLEAEISRVTAARAARGEVMATEARQRRELESLVTRRRRDLVEARCRLGADARTRFRVRRATPLAE